MINKNKVTNLYGSLGIFGINKISGKNFLVQISGNISDKNKIKLAKKYIKEYKTLYEKFEVIDLKTMTKLKDTLFK